MLVPFPRAVGFAHAVLAEVLAPGERSVDATCGNGFDTVFLAERVGEMGMVAGFDIQEAAIEATRGRLQTLGLASRARLFHEGHESMLDRLGDWIGGVRAIVFNLGYLPGGDRAVTTRPDTTIAGLRQAMALLVSGGVMTVTVYPGHSGGHEEAHAVERYLGSLSQKSASVIRYGFVNERNDPPYVFALSKE